MKPNYSSVLTERLAQEYYSYVTSRVKALGLQRHVQFVNRCVPDALQRLPLTALSNGSTVYNGCTVVSNGSP